MRCRKCGSNWIEKATVQTEGDGVTHEWLCKKCGSTKMEDGEMKGTCGNCGRQGMTVQKLDGTQYCGTCTATYYKHPAGDERNKAMAQKAAILKGGMLTKVPTQPKAQDADEPPFDRKGRPIQDNLQGSDVIEVPMRSNRIPKPAPSNGNCLFPPLTIKFEDRDNALVDALEAEAIKQRRTPTQQILYLLERHYGLTP